MWLWKSFFNNQTQSCIPHFSCFSKCVRGSRSFTVHSGNHAVGDFEIAFDYMLSWDLLIWDLKGRVCFGSLIKIFVPVYCSTLSSSCICSVLSHTAPTADILLVMHFYISPCEVLHIHTPFLLHNYTYLIVFFYLCFYLWIWLFNYDCNRIYNLFK